MSQMLKKGNSPLLPVLYQIFMDTRNPHLLYNTHSIKWIPSHQVSILFTDLVVFLEKYFFFQVENLEK